MVQMRMGGAGDAQARHLGNGEPVTALLLGHLVLNEWRQISIPIDPIAQANVFNEY